MIKVEKSCGIILVLRRENDENRFLILRQNNDTESWSFPKGHIEEGETLKETALRELKEETGIIKVKFSNLPNIIEKYDFEKNGETIHKINELFIAFTEDDQIKIKEDEILEYRWATYKEAINIYVYELQKKNLEKVREYLRNYESGK